MTSFISWSRSSSRMCSMHGLPAIGTIGFGWFDVSGLSRVPSPPAMTTAFISLPSPPVALCPRASHRERRPRKSRTESCANLAPGLPEVLDECRDGEREPGPEDPQRPVGALVRHHHERQRRVEEPGRRLTEEVDLEGVAARHGRLVPDEEQDVTQRDRE